MRVLNGKLAAPDNDRCNPSESWSFLLVSSQSTQAGTGHPSKPLSTRVLVVTCSADEGRSGTCFGFFGPHQGSRITCPQKIWSAVDECPKRSVQCGKVTGQQTYLAVLDAGNRRCKSTWLIGKSRKPPYADQENHQRFGYRQPGLSWDMGFTAVDDNWQLQLKKSVVVAG